MPYKTLDEAQKGGFPTKADDIELTLAQVNKLADIYDALKRAGKVDNPMSVAWTQWKKMFEKKDDKWAVKEHSEDKETFNVDDKEIFAVGTWKGDKYTAKDLDEIVTAFNDLKFDVPLKLGHKNKTLLNEDGYPAAGWVKSLKRVGEKLVASFKNVPRVVKEFIEKQAYKNISAEIAWNFKDEAGKLFPRVLYGVALLGEDIPAVKGLGDWSNFYSDDVRLYTLDVTAEGRVSMKQNTEKWSAEYIDNLPDTAFAFIERGGEKDDEGKTVPRALRHLSYKDENGKIDLPHLRDALARLGQTKLSAKDKARARENLIKEAQAVGMGEHIKKFEEVDMEKIQELETKIKELEGQVKEKEQQFSDSEKVKQDLEKQLSELRATQREAEIQSFIDEMKKEGKLLPAQESTVKTILFSLDDGKVVKFSDNGKDEEISARKLVERYISGLPKIVELAEKSGQGEDKGTKPTDDGTSEVGQKLHAFTVEFMKTHKDVSYEVALLEVSKQHSELCE